MSNQTTKTSPLHLARTAGWLYLLMVPFAIFGVMWVPSIMFVPGDAAATANNIMASEGLFRLGIVSALIVQVLHIFVVLALYRLLKPVSKNWASLLVIFGLVGVPISMLSELNQYAALALLSGADYLATFTADQLNTQVTLFLGLREQGLIIAWIFWGLWLYPMGYLVFKSGYIPRILGILLMIGCVGYQIDFLTTVLFPNSAVLISGVTSIGEIFLPLWLVIKGVDVEQWDKWAAKSA
ncbi:DUF4386 domain-containing protein [Candidatus Neomarinimicrobiota bacterium]